MRGNAFCILATFSENKMDYLHIEIVISLLEQTEFR